MRVAMSIVMRWALTVAVLCTSLPMTLRAQGGTGRIEGIVRDEQGGVLPGVTIVLRNQDSGVTRTLATESDGRYAFPALAPGQYSCGLNSRASRARRRRTSRSQSGSSSGATSR